MTALVFIGDDSGSDEPIAEATEVGAAAGQSDATAGTGLEDAVLPPIDLAPPYGTEPRTRPLQSVWMFGEDLTHNPAIADVVREEAELAVEYLAEWSMPGDGLAIESGPPRRLGNAESELVAAAAQPVTRMLSAPTVLDEVRTSLSSYPDDHTSVLLVSTDPSVSAAILSPRTSEVHDEREAAQHRFVIGIETGAGSDPSLRAEARLPSRITVDPTVRGDLATVLARSWVESYGGGWTNGR